MVLVKKMGRVFRKIPAIYLTLIVAIIINGLMNPRMFTERGINNLLLQVMPMVLAAMAQTSVMIVGELDISIGAVVGLSTVILAVTMGQLGWLSVLLVMLVVVAIGLVTGFVVAYFNISGIVATLSSSMIFSGLALLILPVPGGLITPGYSKFFTGVSFSVPNTLFMLIFLLLIWEYIKKRPMGINIYAAGGNYYSAFATGIPVKKAKMLAFVICAVLSGLSGMVLAAKTMSGDANIAISYSITSIAGAVLGGVSFAGGIGHMARAAAGAVVISILVNILFFLQVESFWQYAVQGIILLAAVCMSQLNRKI